MGPVIKLIAGSYEQIAFGYRLSTGEQVCFSFSDFFIFIPDSPVCIYDKLNCLLLRYRLKFVSRVGE